VCCVGYMYILCLLCVVCVVCVLFVVCVVRIVCAGYSSWGCKELDMT